MTYKIKVIKTEEDYREALKYFEELMNKDPDPDSDDGEKLSLLATLIEDYESKTIPESLPNPIDAIKFRMEQQNLKPIDLVPYLGGRSRVSEILSGKRRLTLDMVRSLEAGLGIPAKVLIQKPDQNIESDYQHWDNTLVKIMESRGYFENMSLKIHDKSELLKNFFSRLTGQGQTIALLRKANYRLSPRTDRNALSAWLIRVLQKAEKVKVTTKYKHGLIDLAFMQNIVKLSVHEKSPLVIQEYLKKYGIKIIIEPHLPKTHLDGAVIIDEKDSPIIGLTLRFNRLDYYWFTLMHELAHIALHHDKNMGLYYDEFEKVKGLDIDPIEREADKLASEALVPSSKWEISPAKLIPSSIAANSLAKELGVNIVIIAGKIRYEGGNWKYLNNIIGQAKIQQYYPDQKWEKE